LVAVLRGTICNIPLKIQSSGLCIL
jgi:hypothetical protein